VTPPRRAGSGERCGVSYVRADPPESTCLLALDDRPSLPPSLAFSGVRQTLACSVRLVPCFPPSVPPLVARSREHPPPHHPGINLTPRYTFFPKVPKRARNHKIRTKIGPIPKPGREICRGRGPHHPADLPLHFSDNAPRVRPPQGGTLGCTPLQGPFPCSSLSHDSRERPGLPESFPHFSLSTGLTHGAEPAREDSHTRPPWCPGRAAA
jgi:hypothetical protein